MRIVMSAFIDDIDLAEDDFADLRPHRLEKVGELFKVLLHGVLYFGWVS